MNILDALRDPKLFGAMPTFRELESWSRWETFLAAVYGIPMSTDQVETFRRHTGRAAPNPKGYREAVCIVGRQSGKSRVASLIVSFEAISDQREPDGTDVYALLVAQDQRGALRTLFSYSAAPFETVPLLKGEVISRTNESLALRNGVTIAAYPCRPAAVRGVRARVAVCDELAFFRSSENMPSDTEMLRALRPTLATTGGKLIILSSPYGQAGALWELYRSNFGRDESPVLVWQASAADMNPSLAADYLARMKETDPDGYRAEVLGEFRAGVSTLLDPDAIQACVAPGRRELAPVAGVSYSAFVDPSGGRRDAFALAIAHRSDDRVEVDVVRAWRSRNPAGTVEEIADLLKSYRLRKVIGDRYGGEWPREAFREKGIEYDIADLDRSALYLELLPRVNQGAVVLPEDEALLSELRGLERRRGASGRDRVDHRPGSHDDRANVVAGVVREAFRRSERVELAMPISITRTSLAEMAGV